MTPLYKILMEGNTPSLPRFIGNWPGFFSSDAGLVQKCNFFARYSSGSDSPDAPEPGHPGSQRRKIVLTRFDGTSLAYTFHEET